MQLMLVSVRRTVVDIALASPLQIMVSSATTSHYIHSIYVPTAHFAFVLFSRVFPAGLSLFKL